MLGSGHDTDSLPSLIDKAGRHFAARRQIALTAIREALNASFVNREQQSEVALAKAIGAELFVNGR